jgi:hypothetical protein
MLGEAGMIVKLLLPLTDRSAQEIVVKFKNDGIASVSADDMHFGFVRRVGEEDGKIAIVADITEPGLVEWIKENVGEGEPIDIGSGRSP